MAHRPPYHQKSTGTGARINRPGLHNTPSYQVSGIPFITGCLDMTLGGGTSSVANTREVKFPYVTKKFTIMFSASQGHPAAAGTINTGSILRLSFRRDGDPACPHVYSGHHYIDFGSGSFNQGDTPLKSQVSMEVKCSEIFVKRIDRNAGAVGFKVIAELTGIEPREMYTLTGSGLTDAGSHNYWEEA
tara:strand:- start:2610 stop:3173 length:564 start_codon:yes stop_codon:yes gene_type:complete